MTDFRLRDPFPFGSIHGFISEGRASVNPETSAAKAWLGRLALSDPEVGREFRTLSTALNIRFLADAMRQYVFHADERAERAGGVPFMSVFGPDAIERVDFYQIAADFQQTAQRFAQSHVGGSLRPFIRFR